MCHILMAQNDTSRIAGLPYSSYLIQVDSLSDLKLGNDKFVFSEFTHTLDSNKHWEFIGLKIESTDDGGITDEKKKPLIRSYKSKNDYQIINSGEALLETFEIKELRDFRYFMSSGFGTSYPWTPIYKGKYLIIEKCEGYIGGQISYETKFEYFFVEKINTNYQQEFSQTNMPPQNDIVEQINNVVELIDKEKFDTLIFESIHLRFDTLSVSPSPVNKTDF